MQVNESSTIFMNDDQVNEPINCVKWYKVYKEIEFKKHVRKNIVKKIDRRMDEQMNKAREGWLNEQAQGYFKNR